MPHGKNLGVPIGLFLLISTSVACSRPVGLNDSPSTGSWSETGSYGGRHSVEQLSGEGLG